MPARVAIGLAVLWAGLGVLGACPPTARHAGLANAGVCGPGSRRFTPILARRANDRCQGFQALDERPTTSSPGGRTIIIGTDAVSGTLRSGSLAIWGRASGVRRSPYRARIQSNTLPGLESLILTHKSAGFVGLVRTVRSLPCRGRIIQPRATPWGSRALVGPSPEGAA